MGGYISENDFLLFSFLYTRQIYWNSVVGGCDNFHVLAFTSSWVVIDGLFYFTDTVNFPV